MKESVAIAKEGNAKKDFSPTKSSDNSIHRVRNEPERQLGSLRSVIDNIRHDGGTPSVESIATELSNVPTAQRAPALLALQRTHGNQYVQRVVTGIQAKLSVGQPGDIYEQEADRVADAVMRMPEPIGIRHVEEIIQNKQQSDHDIEVAPDVEARINLLRGGGQPLPYSVRTLFEPRFGYDFRQVRVHTDARAAETARAVNARAYTLGHDVVFGAGQYETGTAEGQRLIAHELTHVVQQTENIQRAKSKVHNDLGTEKKDAESALKKAEQMVNKSQIYMGGKRMERYQTWYDSNYVAANATATKRFDGAKNGWVKIHSVCLSKTIEFDCSARNENYYAAVDTSDGRYKMNLGKDFWNAAETGRDSRGGAIVHEISHEEVDTDDHVYGEAGAKQLAQNDPEKAIDNADNWEYFAEDSL